MKAICCDRCKEFQTLSDNKQDYMSIYTSSDLARYGNRVEDAAKHLCEKCYAAFENFLAGFGTVA